MDREREGRRGGRRPGEWTCLRAAEIVKFREEHGVSRARLARALGVSATSVQNWEAGSVPATQSQELLRGIIDDPSLLAENEQEPTAGHEVVRATGEIVRGFAWSHPGITADDLIVVIRRVRQALTARGPCLRAGEASGQDRPS